LFSWLILLIIRKARGSMNETKQYLFLSFSGLFVPLLMEIFATSSKLWNNIYRNWPIILWLMYFAAILFAHLQIVFLYARASRRILNLDKITEEPIMTEQTALAKFFRTESVCKSCKHLTKLEGFFYCKFLGALLADQTLYLPCDFKKTF
jgi:hypothetical protein